MERSIRNSAKALIIKNGKMLAVKMKDSEGTWYIMPGGGQESEELLPDTVCREAAEELGIKVIPGELAFIIEAVHGEKFHCVDLVFLCQYIGKIENAVMHEDTNQIGYEWLDIDTLINQPLYPSKLRRQIINLYHGEKYTIYLGNEEIGDPEFLN